MGANPESVSLFQYWDKTNRGADIRAFEESESPQRSRFRFFLQIRMDRGGAQALKSSARNRKIRNKGLHPGSSEKSYLVIR